LGCGIDRVYPPQNGKLMEKIARTGTVLTEYAPGTEPFGKNFPIRNRIISGLSQGTVVVEANARSGSLITANYAQKQGRDIFAFPGTVDAPHATGTNALIKRGAKLVTCAEDVLEEYELLYPDRIFTEQIATENYRRRTEPLKKNAENEAVQAEIEEAPHKEKTARALIKKKRAKAVPTAKEEPAVSDQPIKASEQCEDPYCREVLSVMHDAMSVEEIASALSEKNGAPRDIASILGALTMLEIEEFAEALPGGLYRRR